MAIPVQRKDGLFFYINLSTFYNYTQVTNLGFCLLNSPIIFIYSNHLHNFMTLPLPKWEMKKYALLWRAFEQKEFTNEQALNTLKEKDNHILSVLFYDLKKMGWVEVNRDLSDQRRKIYKLKEPNKAVKEIATKN